MDRGRGVILWLDTKKSGALKRHEILKYELTYYKLSVKRLNSVTVSSLFTD
jgi:hypothetical protein